MRKCVDGFECVITYVDGQQVQQGVWLQLVVIIEAVVWLLWYYFEQIPIGLFAVDPDQIVLPGFFSAHIFPFE